MIATPMHVYEVKPRKDRRGVDLISDALPFGRLWYSGESATSNAIVYAEHDSRSRDAVIRVYDAAGKVIETHEHKGDFKAWRDLPREKKPPCGEARRLIIFVWGWGLAWKIAT